MIVTGGFSAEASISVLNTRVHRMPVLRFPHVPARFARTVRVPTVLGSLVGGAKMWLCVVILHVVTQLVV